MKLILSVTSEQRTDMGVDRRHVFGSEGGSIGRAQESDWVLPDTNRIVSNKHSLIDFRDGGFYLTDTSTNGVFLNDAVKPLGYNSAVLLHEGDSLAIGDYKIHVEIEGSDKILPPTLGDDSARPVDAKMPESTWPESETPQPQPLGLGEKNGLRLDSRLSLPKEWDSADDRFNQPASQADHTPAIKEAFSYES
jgi:type VI secretion system protein